MTQGMVHESSETSGSLRNVVVLGEAGEWRCSRVHMLHYSSYYTSFFIPAFLAAWRLPIVTQYTGGVLPTNTLRRVFWKLSILPSLKACRAVLLGNYYSEIRSLIFDLGVARGEQEFFNAPGIDSKGFHA